MSILTWRVNGEMVDGSPAKGRTFVIEFFGFSIDFTVQRKR